MDGCKKHENGLQRDKKLGVGYGSSSSSSKLNRAKQTDKRVVSCDEEKTPFSRKWYESRHIIQKALNFYRELLVDKKQLDHLLQEHGKSSGNYGIKLHMREANKVLETMGKSLNNAKQIGHISGIKVGDEFYWRGELSIVGLHYDFQRGIDSMKSLNGKLIATSIIDSGRYENIVEIGSDKLIYYGEGQNGDLNCGKKPKDQKLSRGNLALKNNMVDKLPVRLICRVVSDNCNYSFVYDGLYHVTDYRKEKGKFGTNVYKFLLRKYEERASV